MRNQYLEALEHVNTAISKAGAEIFPDNESNEAEKLSDRIGEVGWTSKQASLYAEDIKVAAKELKRLWQEQAAVADEKVRWERNFPTIDPDDQQNRWKTYYLDEEP